jgi:hypothetical protein
MIGAEPPAPAVECEDETGTYHGNSIEDRLSCPATPERRVPPSLPSLQPG